MELTAGQLVDAYDALRSISERDRLIPQLAKYKLARIYTTLQPYYVQLNSREGEIVARLGQEVFADEAKTVSKGWTVNPGTPEFDQYVKEWTVIREEKMEVPVAPITLQSLGNDPRGISMEEFAKLGPLCVDLDAALATVCP